MDHQSILPEGSQRRLDLPLLYRIVRYNRTVEGHYILHTNQKRDGMDCFLWAHIKIILQSLSALEIQTMRSAFLLLFSLEKVFLRPSRRVGESWTHAGTSLPGFGAAKESCSWATSSFLEMIISFHWGSSPLFSLHFFSFPKILYKKIKAPGMVLESLPTSLPPLPLPPPLILWHLRNLAYTLEMGRVCRYEERTVAHYSEFIFWYQIQSYNTFTLK